MDLLELQARQALPLEEKVGLTKSKIRQWLDYWDAKSWQDNVDYMPYVSFSGGKDSTVLATIARKVDKNIPLVFMDTGIEYPEIRALVKSFIKSEEKPNRIELKKSHRPNHPGNLCDVYEKSNLYILHPKVSFKEVVENHGYPVVSKEVSNCIAGAKVEGTVRWKRIHGELMNGDRKSLFNCEKWLYLLDAPFKCSDSCCHYLKKQPIAVFEEKFHGIPMVAIMAEESRQRKIKYLKSGCNSFDDKKPQSQPMGFWTEQDVLHYLKDNQIEYAKVYGDIVYVKDSEGEKLVTTGERRTGCMFCMFGVHLEKGENRFQRMKRTHRKQYDAAINNLGYGKVLDYLGIEY